MPKTRTRRKPARKATRQRTQPATQAPDPTLTPAGPGDKLTEEQQREVVQRLAMFDTPQQVAEFVREEFGIEITRQSVQHYDPTHGPKPAMVWCRIFEETRAAFLKSTAEIPAANRSVRIRWLQRMALAAEKTRNVALASQILEQIAKETGELYTNKRNIGVSGELKGGVLAVPVPIGAEEWGLVAAAQQAGLRTRAHDAVAEVTGNGNGKPQTVAHTARVTA